VSLRSPMAVETVVSGEVSEVVVPKIKRRLELMIIVNKIAEAMKKNNIRANLRFMPSLIISRQKNS